MYKKYKIQRALNSYDEIMALDRSEEVEQPVETSANQQLDPSVQLFTNDLIDAALPLSRANQNADSVTQVSTRHGIS